MSRPNTSTKALTTSNVKNKSLSLKLKDTDTNFGHIIMIIIIPSIMHLSAYIMGFIYFRIRENEQLYALMEKVFLSVDQSTKQVSQDKVIRRLKYILFVFFQLRFIIIVNFARIFIFLGLFWIFVTLCLHVYLMII